VTPPSVRFLGRRVYLGAIVVLACVLRQWPTPWRVARLGEVLGVSRDTLARWHRWWRDVFVRTAFWKAAVAALRKTRKSGLVDPNILWIGRGRLSDSWWLVLVPVKAPRFAQTPLRGASALTGTPRELRSSYGDRSASIGAVQISAFSSER